MHLLSAYRTGVLRHWLVVLSLLHLTNEVLRHIGVLPGHQVYYRSTLNSARLSGLSRLPAEGASFAVLFGLDVSGLLTLPKVATPVSYQH
jgi:hypothetical protein